jgi:conjugative coupling factor TraD (TOL family)
MSDVKVEALLRPSVELGVALAAFSCALIIFMNPVLFMITEHVSWGVACLFLIFGFVRFTQGRRIYKYQRNLKRLPQFTLKSAQIPVSRTRIWMGKGFDWNAKHTQRFSDLKQPSTKKYTEMGVIFDYIRHLEVKYEDSPKVMCFLSPFGSNTVFNPFRPLPPVGGDKTIHAVDVDEMDANIPLGTRNGHTLVLGTTRVGKSRLLEVLVTQAIHRKNSEDVYEGPVVVIDPKGDAELMARVYTEAKKAGREMMIFHLGFPDMSCRYNAIAGSFSRYTEIASRSTDSMSGSGDGAAFKDFAWRFTNVIAMAQVALGERPTFETIQEYMLNIEPLFIRYTELYLDKTDEPSWFDIVNEMESNLKPQHIPRNLQSRGKRTVVLIQYLQDRKIFDSIVTGLLSSVAYEKSYYDRITASFLPLLEKLTSGRVLELIAPDYDDLSDKRPILDWQKIARNGSVVYVGLDAMTDQTVSDVVGGNMFSDIVSMSGYIYKFGMQDGFGKYTKDGIKPVFSIFADEVNELIGPKFIPLLNKAGGSGVNVTAFTQSYADVPAKLGDQYLASVVFSNFNTLVMMRVKTKETAELLTNQLGEVYVNNVTTVSGVNDNSNVDNQIHFTSKNEDRLTTEKVAMVETDTIINLPIGQAFALLEGSRLMKLRFPMLTDCLDELPPTVMDMYRLMSEQYKTSENWWNPSEFTDQEVASNAHQAHDVSKEEMELDYAELKEDESI